MGHLSARYFVVIDMPVVVFWVAYSRSIPLPPPPPPIFPTRAICAFRDLMPQLAGYANPLELAAAYLDAAQASVERQAAKRGGTSQASNLQKRTG